MLIEEKIRIRIQQSFHPTFLDIVNESKMHHGQKNLETHFRIHIVSEKFNDQKRIDRHRSVQNILKDEFSLIKAFSLHTYTPGEWINQNEIFQQSPTCQGSINA